MEKKIKLDVRTKSCFAARKLNEFFFYKVLKKLKIYIMLFFSFI